MPKAEAMPFVLLVQTWASSASDIDARLTQDVRLRAIEHTNSVPFFSRTPWNTPPRPYVSCVLHALAARSKRLAWDSRGTGRPSYPPTRCLPRAPAKIPAERLRRLRQISSRARNDGFKSMVLTYKGFGVSNLCNRGNSEAHALPI